MYAGWPCAMGGCMNRASATRSPRRGCADRRYGGPPAPASSEGAHFRVSVRPRARMNDEGPARGGPFLSRRARSPVPAIETKPLSLGDVDVHRVVLAVAVG